MKIEIRRLEVSKSGMSQLGQLLIDDKHFCWTMERGPKVPDHPPIPTGEYQSKVTLSPHLRYRCPEVLDVPGRTGIRIHVANYWYQLEGCTAIGFDSYVDNLGEHVVYQSRKALDELLRVLPPTFVVAYTQKETQP